MAIDRVEQVDVAVLFKVRVQGETQQAEIPPSADFVMEINERGRETVAVGLDNPDPPGSFPDIHPSEDVKRQPAGFLPSPSDRFFREVRREGGGLQPGLAGEEQAQDAADDTRQAEAAMQRLPPIAGRLFRGATIGKLKMKMMVPGQKSSNGRRGNSHSAVKFLNRPVGEKRV